ncbi:unnamed protein product [Symbiodinium natans]|uniref:Uncharacterized protein n=1 Tax=Symbiodinium natans TaxID=878477 RepID=A0A812TMI2_9DINO|nr:unnamed protein product [Symbiodinium natans]
MALAFIVPCAAEARTDRMANLKMRRAVAVVPTAWEQGLCHLQRSGLGSAAAIDDASQAVLSDQGWVRRSSETKMYPHAQIADLDRLRVIGLLGFLSNEPEQLQAIRRYSAFLHPVQLEAVPFPKRSLRNTSFNEEEEKVYWKVDCETGKVDGFKYTDPPKVPEWDGLGPRMRAPLPPPAPLPPGKLPPCLPGDSPFCTPDDDDNPLCHPPPPPPPPPPKPKLDEEQPEEQQDLPEQGQEPGQDLEKDQDQGPGLLAGLKNSESEGQESAGEEQGLSQGSSEGLMPKPKPAGIGEDSADGAQGAGPGPKPAQPPPPRLKCLPGQEIPFPKEPCQIKQGLCCHKCHTRADCKLCLEWKEVLGQIPVDIDRKAWAENICPPPKSPQEGDDSDLQKDYLLPEEEENGPGGSGSFGVDDL